MNTFITISFTIGMMLQILGWMIIFTSHDWTPQIDKGERVMVTGVIVCIIAELIKWLSM